MVQTYRPGTPQAMWNGDQLAMYESWNAYYRLVVAAQQLAGSVDARNVSAVTASAGQARRAQLVITAAAAVALAFGLASAAMVTRSIVRPVSAAPVLTWNHAPSAPTPTRRCPPGASSAVRLRNLEPR